MNPECAPFSAETSSASKKPNLPETAAAKRERLLSKIQLVDDCAKTIGGGEWYAVIIQNVCIGYSYQNIDKALMPTSKSNSFFRMRREFFRLLDEKKEIFDGA